MRIIFIFDMIILGMNSKSIALSNKLNKLIINKWFIISSVILLCIIPIMQLVMFGTGSIGPISSPLFGDANETVFTWIVYSFALINAIPSFISVLFVAIRKKSFFYYYVVIFPLLIASNIILGLYFDVIQQTLGFTMLFIMFIKWDKEEAIDKVQRLSFKKISLIVIAITALTISAGFLMMEFTPPYEPYTWIVFLDISTLLFTLVGMYYLSKFNKDSYVLFLIGDFVGFALFASVGVYGVAASFILYTILDIVGYVNWNAQYDRYMHSIKAKSN